MKILGIETSCDETALSLLECSGEDSVAIKVLGEQLFSQASLHAPYGGVFPNLAKREHAKNLTPLLKETLKDATMLVTGTTTIDTERLHELLLREPELAEQLIPFLETHVRPDIDALAVTVGPGLEPALWVGINFARALSIAWNMPVIPVNHMEGHLMIATATWEAMQGSWVKPAYPLLALLVSGGHTELVLSKEYQHYELLGETRDDAAGECFDKCARIIGLPYPGGPEISKLAAQARKNDTLPSVTLPRPMMREKSYDFSYSGLKTAVRNAWTTESNQTAFAREIEDAILDVLIDKTMRAAEEYNIATLVVSGGVAANSELRRRLTEHAPEHLRVLFPTASLSTDNARMITLAAYLRRESTTPIDYLVANGQLSLTA